MAEKKVKAQIIDTRVTAWEPPAIGNPVYLEFKERKFYSIVRGVEGREHIFIDIPREGTQTVLPDYGLPIQIRFLVAGVVNSFNSAVSDAHPKLGLMVIKYPTMVEQVSLRGSARVALVYPAALRAEGIPGKMTGALVDLSEEGAQFAVDPVSGLDQIKNVEAEIVLPGYMPQGENLHGVVQRIRQSPRGKSLVGIRFKGMETAAVKAIQRFYRDSIRFVLPLNSQPPESEDFFHVSQRVILYHGGRKGESTVRGWKSSGKPFFLVDRPSGMMADSELKLGKSWNILFEKNGKAMRISTFFFGQLKRERLFVFGDLGEKAEQAMREHERYLCSIPVDISIGGERVGKGFIGDISQGGLMMVTNVDRPVDDLFFLDFSMGDLGNIVLMRFDILNVVKEGGLYIISGKFRQRGDEQLKVLTQYSAFLNAWSGNIDLG